MVRGRVVVAATPVWAGRRGLPRTLQAVTQIVCVSAAVRTDYTRVPSPRHP